jgi:ribonuclease BN (tRNA processing enzyme)
MLQTLIVLGGGGWLPAHGRQTACALLRNGKSAILIDAGTGISRLVERPELLDGVERLDILLTHFHLDHVAGLAYLPAIDVCDHTTVWGPGLQLYDTSTDALIASVSHEPFHPVPLEDQDVEVRDLPPGEIELAGVHVRMRAQQLHSAPTLAFRFDDVFAWITDTAYDPASAQFAGGCRMLAHEAWFTSAKPRNADIHSSATQAAEVATRAGIERLLLIHLPPFAEAVNELALEAQSLVPSVLIARDGADVSALLSE